jgi:hypothetical protein
LIRRALIVIALTGPRSRLSKANPATNFVMNLMRFSTKEIVRNVEKMVPIMRRFWRHGPDSFSVSDVDGIGAHYSKQNTG